MVMRIRGVEEVEGDGGSYFNAAAALASLPRTCTPRLGNSIRELERAPKLIVI